MLRETNIFKLVRIIAKNVSLKPQRLGDPTEINANSCHFQCSVNDMMCSFLKYLVHVLDFNGDQRFRGVQYHLSKLILN